MAASGWYPDPSGVRGRFRYWDGTSWSAETTTNPGGPPPKGTGPSNQSDEKNRGWAVALIVLAIVTVVAVVVLFFSAGIGPGHHQSVAEDTNSSTPTVSAWDETSSPTPSTPPPPVTTGGVWVDCPVSTGNADTRQTGGQITSGGLSTVIPSGYSSEFFADMSMTYDAHGLYRDIPPANLFFSSVQVGRVSMADGFTDLVTTATQAMQCWSSTDHPVEGPATILIGGDAMSISGHSAWHIRWQIPYTTEPIPGEVLDIIAVDMGAGADYIGLYWSCRPVGDYPDFEASIDQAISGLTVS